MEIVRHLNEATRGDIGCELAVQRPEDTIGIKVATGEGHNLLCRVDTFVRPTSNERLSILSVWCERCLEITLYGANVGLLGISEEWRSVVGEVEAVRRH